MIEPTKKPALNALKFLEQRLQEQIKAVVRAEDMLNNTGLFNSNVNSSLYDSAREKFLRSVEKAHDYWGRLEIQDAEKKLTLSNDWSIGRGTKNQHALPSRKQVEAYRKELEERKRIKSESGRLE